MKRLFVVGLGPGGRDGMTLEAKKALEQSEVICGYTAYADLIREDYPEKEYLVSGMTKEVERCHMALLVYVGGMKKEEARQRFWQRRTEKRRQ